MQIMEANCMLPEDLIEGILSRLGVRDLLRLRCVCKSWCSLIDNPTFVLTHYHHQYAMHRAEGDVPLVLCRISTYLFSDPICFILSKHQGDDEDVLVSISADLERDIKLVLNNQGHLRCKLANMGMANGVVCLHLHYTFDIVPDGFSWRECYALWNPATRDCNVVPNIIAIDQDVQTVVNGFAYDHLSNDFKIVACIGIGDRRLGHEVYSLSTNSWKRLPYLHVYLFPSRMDACLNGVYYWTAHNGDRNDSIFHIVSLSFSSEGFEVLDPPQCVPLPKTCEPEFVPQIGLYKEWLALIFTRRIPDEAVAKVDIWVATKFDAEHFGVPLEWQCLLVVKPFTRFYVRSRVRTSRMDGQLLLLTNNDDNYSIKEWNLYDPETGKSKNLRIRCFDRFHSFRYVESLFPVSRTITQT